MESAFLRCLLLILLSFVVFSTAQARTALSLGKPVRDTDGNHVLSGFPYYLGATADPNGGRLGVKSMDANVCPLHVFLTTLTNGPAVLLFPKVGGNGRIHLDEEIAVMVAKPPPPPCNASTMWRVDADQTYVTTGGVQDSNAWFYIVENPLKGGYQFQWCPDTTKTCKTIGTIGTDQLLGISSESIALEFIKVPGEASMGSAFMRPIA